MAGRQRITAWVLLSVLVFVLQTATHRAQQAPRQARDAEEAPQTGGTMRPVIRGVHAAVSSMKPEATRAAENILRSGGNAFDAAVAGQAVLALVDEAGSDPSRGKYPAFERQRL